VHVIINTAAYAAAPRGLEKAPGVRSRRGTVYNLRCLYNMDLRLLLRMRRPGFRVLLELVRSDLETNNEMAVHPSRPPIPMESRLVLAFRILAVDSYSDVIFAFGIGRSTVYTIYHQVSHGGY